MTPIPDEPTRTCMFLTTPHAQGDHGPDAPLRLKPCHWEALDAEPPKCASCKGVGDHHYAFCGETPQMVVCEGGNGHFAVPAHERTEFCMGAIPVEVSDDGLSYKVVAPIPDEGARVAWEPFERVHEAHLKMLAKWGEIPDESEQEAHHIITSAHNLIAQLTTELAEARRELARQTSLWAIEAERWEIVDRALEENGDDLEDNAENGVVRMANQLARANAIIERVGAADQPVRDWLTDSMKACTACVDTRGSWVRCSYHEGADDAVDRAFESVERTISEANKEA